MASDTDYFNCTQCGDCCKGFGGTYLTEEDMSAIADHLNISVAAFRENYCDPSGSRFVLSQGKDGYCVFWDTICTIHEIKPRMCKAWPFIDGVLKDIGNWKAMAGVCPGMRADADEAGLRNVVCKALGRTSSREK